MEQDYRAPVTAGDRVRAGLAMQMIAMTFSVPIEGMATRKRLGLKACKGRWLSMYLSHVGFGWPLERVGHAFGVNRVTAGVGCRWVEDARDDPAIDTLLDCLEGTLRTLCEAPRLELRA